MSKAEILESGELQGLDNSGFIINNSSAQNITEPWKSVVNEIINLYVTHIPEGLLHSIYIRGSVGRGNAVEGVSDIDTIAVVKNSSEINKDWRHQAISDLSIKYPFATGFELVFWDLVKVLDESNIGKRFDMKTQFACIYGDDLLKVIPGCIPSAAVSKIKTSNLSRDLQESVDNLNHENGASKAEQICRWTMKRILRAGFFLVMPNAQVFTKDLYPSYKLFSVQYPEKQKDMYEVLDLAINPSSDMTVTKDIISNFGHWIVQEIQNKYA